MKSSCLVLICALCCANGFGQNVGVGTNAPGARLDVTKPGGDTPTMNIRGSVNMSHFNFGLSENTFIRGGKSGSHVILNDLAGPNGYVGVGTSAPMAPLTFPGSLGNKIALWNDGATTHYGFGIQSGLLQIFTKTINDDVAFGYGNSSSFNETMRIKGNGILQFPAGLSKKIIFYPGSVGDAFIGVFPNELRISSDYSGADITFGYDNRTSGYTEKFRMKASGAFAVNGNIGSTAQILQSTGNGSPQWQPLSNILQTHYRTGGYAFVTNTNPTGTFYSYNISLPTAARLIISATFNCSQSYNCAFGCSDGITVVDIIIDNNPVNLNVYMSAGGNSKSAGGITNYFYDLPAGNHEIHFVVKYSTGSFLDVYGVYSTIIVIPTE